MELLYSFPALPLPPAYTSAWLTQAPAPAVQYRAQRLRCSLLQCSANRKLQGATRALALAVFDPVPNLSPECPPRGQAPEGSSAHTELAHRQTRMVLTVLQDAKMFRRKKWKYLILDEAHMIKNWRSQRWQTLLNFNSRRRLLITGACVL